ncbi:hypothetical protein ACN5L9_001616 [Cronobacter sakazakii]|uniref:hypothetical protein n=1 Tax=Cronobacter sakazakii TaxID=28141 RepID=UPI000CFCB74C|nr:hypothetical protein [Cronobacter sakazakii]PQZ45630.1 hypothetical protein C5976_05920 [Cronobacter sakazakii]
MLDSLFKTFAAIGAFSLFAISMGWMKYDRAVVFSDFLIIALFILLEARKWYQRRKGSQDKS